MKRPSGDGDGDGGWGWGGVEIKRRRKTNKKSSTLLDLCVSSLRRGHANLLCIVPILTDVPRKESSQICVFDLIWSLAVFLHLLLAQASACHCVVFML